MPRGAYFALSIVVAATALSPPRILELRKAGGHHRTSDNNRFPSLPFGRRVMSTFHPLRAHAHDASQRIVPMYDQAAVAALAKRHALASDVSEAVCNHLLGLNYLQPTYLFGIETELL